MFRSFHGIGALVVVGALTLPIASKAKACAKLTDGCGSGASKSARNADEAADLGRRGASEVDPQLLDTARRNLEHADPDVRVQAVEDLARVGSEAEGDIVKALHDEHSTVRQQAAEALGEVGTQVAVESLEAALEDEDPEVRQAAERALRQVEERSAAGSE